MEENKFWHRKQCSNRVFIGPWDIKAPPPPPPEHFVANDSISIHSNESVSSLKLLKRYKKEDERNMSIEFI